MNFLFKLILAACLLTFYTYSYSQPQIEWQICYGGSGDDISQSIQQTSDGGYIIAGFSYSIDSNMTGKNTWSNNYIILKTNSMGEIQWQKFLGGTAHDKAYSIQQTKDGGYIVAGISYSNDGDLTKHHGSTEYSDCWIVKLNSDGQIQWQKSLGGSLDDAAYSIQQTKDGGYIIAGFASSNDGDIKGNHGNYDNNEWWIIKLKPNGDIQWQILLGGRDHESPSCIQETINGGYIIAGCSESIDGDVPGNLGSFDIWIVNLNINHMIQWQRIFGGRNSDKAEAIQQTNDGGYIVAVNTSSDDGDMYVNNGKSDYCILKLNSSGKIMWKKILGGSNIDNITSIQQTYDGGYIVAGSSNSIDGDVLDHHGTSSNFDYWIIKLNSNGDVLWQKSLGGKAEDYAYSVKQTNDGGFIITGATHSYDGDVSGNHGSFDMWIVKLSPDITDVKDNTNPHNPELSISPNPASENISISFPGGINQSIRIYNSLGIEIKRFEEKDLFDKNSININVEEFPSGVYYVRQDIGCLPDIQCLTKSFVVIR